MYFKCDIILQERLLSSDVLPDVRLVESHDVHGVRMAALTGGLGGDAEAEREITHTVDNDSLVLGSVLSDPAQARLHHVVAVQELLLRPGLHPDLVLGVRRQEVQSCDVQSELLGLGELSETCSETHQIFSRHVGTLNNSWKVGS